MDEARRDTQPIRPGRITSTLKCPVFEGRGNSNSRVDVPNRTNALGSTPAASRIMSLTLGWDDLMVGYDDWMNCLLSLSAWLRCCWYRCFAAVVGSGACEESDGPSRSRRMPTRRHDERLGEHHAFFMVLVSQSSSLAFRLHRSLSLSLGIQDGSCPLESALALGE